MTESVWLDKSQTRVVAEGSPEAAWQIHLKDAVKRGLIGKNEPKPAAPPANPNPPRRGRPRKVNKAENQE